MIEVISAMVVAFAVTFTITPSFIRLFSRIGVVGTDQHKKSKPIIPISQGFPTAVGILFGLFAYVAIITFITGNGRDVSLVFASISTIMTITVVGFFDDMFVGKKKQTSRSGTRDFRIGLSQWKKALLILPAAVPLMVINAGHSTMVLPLMGAVNFGVLYPLILVPVGVLCVANAYNMLGAINGIESGMALIALAGLGAFSYITGADEAAAIAFIATAGFLGIMYYAKTPAKIMAGDSATYLAGALIAAVVIVGNIERFGFVVFLPWVAEAFIKLRNGFRGTSLGALNANGALKPLRGKTESLTHVVMNLGDFTERQLMVIFWLIEAACVALAFGLYFTGII